MLLALLMLLLMLLHQELRRYEGSLRRHYRRHPDATVKDLILYLKEQHYRKTNKSTMRKWKQKEDNRLQKAKKKRNEDYTAWDHKDDQPFTLRSAVPIPEWRQTPDSRHVHFKTDDEVAHWIAYGSWSFCTKCKRRRPESAKTINIAEHSAVGDAIARDCGK